MPRPPSKHGLERKYKPWRKGKSKTSKSKGSLKHQLRGKERLLAKVTEDEPDRRKELEEQIQQLKNEIESKRVVDKERKNAKDSHGLRFLERQRLVRAERSTRKLLAAASTNEERSRYEAELQRIALDQVYVAHFPHGIRYIPLFRNGMRTVDVNRKVVRRATTRKRILKNLNDERAKWISEDQYQRLPSTWSVEMEKATFAAPAKGDTAEAEINDNRFSSSMQQHAALLQAAEEAEAAARKEEERNSSSDSSSDSSSQDEANPLTAMQKEQTTTAKQGYGSSETDSSDSDSDSDSSSEDEIGTTSVKSKDIIQSDDSSSNGSSSDSGISVDNEPAVASKQSSSETRIDEEFDDFLMPASHEVNVFEKAKQEAPKHDFTGDKSKGWATQRQRPGQFKKRRVRK